MKVFVNVCQHERIGESSMVKKLDKDGQEVGTACSLLHRFDRSSDRFVAYRDRGLFVDCYAPPRKVLVGFLSRACLRVHNAKLIIYCTGMGAFSVVGGEMSIARSSRC